MRDITHVILARKITPKSKNLFLRIFLPALVLALGVIGALKMSTASGAPPPPSAGVDVFSQCANSTTGNGPTCSWTNGDLNSTNSAYHEGDATPQRLAIQDLTSGSHTITVSYDTTKSGKHAYDYIATDILSENWIQTSDICSSPISHMAHCTTASVATGNIPSDLNITSFDSANPIQVVKARNATSISAGTPTLASGTYTGDSETTLQFTFNVDPTTCKDSYTVSGIAVCEVLITFGGHIASQADWGAGNSAHSISGSPYHISVIQLDGKSTSGGGLDNQIQSSAIVPIISTTPNPTSGTVGTTLNDTASLSGGIAPTGSIVFKLYAPSDPTCSSTPAFTNTVTVNGNGSYSTSSGFASNAVGTWHWAAIYSGDSNNGTVSSSCANEPVILNQGTSATTTTLKDASNATITEGSSVALGTLVHDSASVSTTPSSAPTGSVTFRFYNTVSDCNSDTTFTGGVTKGTIALDGNNPGIASPSQDAGALAPGTYAFKANWPGSTSYQASTSSCETFTVNQGTSTVSTTLKDASNATITEGSHVALGTAVHDSATVTLTPSAAPDGSVTFRFYGTTAACTADTGFTGGTTMGSVALTGTPGVADPSTATSVLAPGTYAFKANWPGNTNYQGNTSSCETFTVDQGTSIVSTTLKNASNATVAVGASVPLGTVMHDLATVTVTPTFAAPTGNVDFTFFSTNDCSDDGVASGSIALDGNNPGVASPSTSTAALTAGSYGFEATWAGDTNYTGNTSTCEHFTVSQAQLGITTTIHDADHNPVTTVDLGSIVHDTAAISGQVGSIVPAGAVTFTYFTSSDCSTGGTTVTTTSDSTDAIRSAATSALAAGAYSYQASIAGDTNYLGATSDCEHLTVNQFTPDIATEIHQIAGQTDTVVSGALPLGSSVQDKATVTGAGITGLEPTGNVEFTFFTGDCTTGVSFAAGTVALDGKDPGTAYPSTLESNLAAGSYSFRAHYVGDSNYSAVTSACEPLTISKAQLGINTTVHSDNPDQALAGDLALGSGAHDSASVTGQVGLLTLPDVTFYFFPKGVSCTDGSTTGGTALNTLTPVAGVAHPSTSETSLAAGTYNFMAVVASNGNYTGATSNCEPFTVDKAQLAVTTNVHNAAHQDITDTSVPLGSVTHDTATVTGGVNGFDLPAVSFSLTSNFSETCNAGAAVANNGTENGAVKSADSSALGAGTYAYEAVVADNSNYTGDTSACEPFTVNKADLALSTEIHNAAEAVVTSVDAGTTVHDKATVSGLVSSIDAANNVTFTFFSGDCATGTPESAGSIAIVNGVAHPSDSKGPLDAGSYAFQASYDGTTDPNYNSATSPCEPLTVNKVTPGISTSASAGGVVGVQINDSATVTGGDSPSGNVTFYLFGPGDNCSDNTTALFTETDPLTAGSAGPTANYTTLAVGTYHWKAAYNGDGNNNTVSSSCDSEAVTTTKASPTISTIPSTGGLVGVVLNDTATLSGGNTPTGSVTFRLFAPSDPTCISTPVYTNIDPTAPYATSPGFTSNTAGTYHWTASYAGDTNNNPAVSACADEAVTVTAPPTTRTLGFWATHLQFTSTIYTLSQLDPIWKLCSTGTKVNSVPVLMGGFYASISKTTTGAKRSALNQARMQLAQQLLAAILNHEAFGSGTLSMINTAEAAYCGTNTSVILAQVTILDTFNNSGDLSPTSLNIGKADPKAAKSIADLVAWNVLP